jgi:hypothetical protein
VIYVIIMDLSNLTSEGRQSVLDKIQTAKHMNADTLDISNILIKEMPKEVCTLTSVTTLNAGSCMLEHVMYWPPNVKIVILSNNMLDQDSINISSIPSTVRVIDLSYNQFTEFTGWPTHLVEIDLSGHDQLATTLTSETLYPSVELPTDCEIFTMENCSLDDDVFKLGIIKLNKKLVSLSLNDNILSDVIQYLPDDCYSMLEKLYLDDNRIDSVDMRMFSSLDILSLRNNLLCDDSVFTSSITKVDLDSNQFTQIPITLTGAIDISIAQNNIEIILDFPSDDLKILDVSGNPIKRIPTDASKLDQFICDNGLDTDDETISIGSNNSLVNLLGNDNGDDDICSNMRDFHVSNAQWIARTKNNNSQSAWDRWQSQQNKFTVTAYSQPKYHSIKHTKTIVV